MSGLRLIGRIIAVFIIFVFIAITPPLLLAYNAQQAALSGDFVDELIRDPDVFEEAIPEIAQDLAESTREDFDTRDTPIARLDADDWERILYAVAPPAKMQRWTEDAFDGFQHWVRRGGRFMEDVIIPFGEIREGIVNDPEQTVLRTLTQAQRACSSGQEPLSSPDDLIPDCRPPALEGFVERLGQRWQEQPREVWRQMMPEGIARYPDDVSVAEFVEEESGEEWWEVRAGWRASRWGLRAARWLLAAFIAGQCAVAMLVVAILAARNLREALRWIGTPLALAGGFTFLLALLLLLGGEIGTLVIPPEEVPIGVQDVVGDSIRAFFRDLWPPMAWQGGVLVLIGLGMWVLSFFASREPAVAPTTAPTAPPPVPPGEPTASAATEETPATEPEAQISPPEEEETTQAPPEDKDTA